MFIFYQNPQKGGVVGEATVCARILTYIYAEY